jgi:2-polyprenyl-6-methoxyphenol hydroxylase-like FAD-dependent oxidoreductase
MAQVERILVLGGGIGGLSAAVALRTAGFQAEVFEQAPELREVGAGVGLWSNAMGSLDQLGVGVEVRRGSRPLRIAAGANPQGRTLTSINLDDLGPDFATAACFVVLRPALLGALARRVPSENIHTNCRAVQIDATGDRVRLRFYNGRVEEGDLLVGADGLHSAVRAHVVGQDEVRYSGQTCFRGVAKMRPPEPGVIREVQGCGQRGSVCPVDEGTVYWWTAHNAPKESLLAPESRKEFLLQRYGGWPFGLPEAIAATPEREILQNDLVDRAPASVCTRGRIALSGDAAHPTTPNLGQGANMAIDDSIALARSLRDEASVSAALDRYQRERIPRTRLVVQRSWSFGRMCTWDSALGVWLREALVARTPARTMRDMLRWQILESVGSL